MINEIVKTETAKFYAMIERELELVTKEISPDELMFIDGNLPEVLAPKVIRHFVLTIKDSNLRPLDERWLVRKSDFEAYQATNDTP